MKLGEVITLKRGYDLPNSKRKHGKYPIVSSSGTTDFHQDYKVKAPGVVTGRYGTIGQVYYVVSDFWPLNTTLFVEDFKNNNPKFINYFLQTLNFQAYAAKSAVPGINRNDLHLADVTIPDIYTQLKISELLSVYDNLIENNTHRIAILEEMAQRLYREWFVHFRFPGHENVKMVDSELGMIPEGWESGYLKGVAQNYRKPVNKVGRKLYNYYLPIDCLPRKSFLLKDVRPIDEAESSLIEFSENDIIMGAMRVYFHKIVPAPFSGLTRSTCFVLRPQKSSYFSFLLMMLYQNESIEYANTISIGATMPYVTWGSFSNMRIIIPPLSIAEKYNQLVSPIVEKIKGMYFQNTNLRKTRDHLLPRLISGDIDVSKINIPTSDDKIDLEVSV